MSDDNAQPLDWKRYGRWYAGVLLLILLTVSGINFVVDPLGRFRLFDAPGVNATKVAVPRDSRVGKPASIYECDYDVILLGSSRVEFGINPEYPGFAGRAYNGGLKGVSLYEIERMGRYVLRYAQPDVVVIGLDFLAFNERRYTNEDFTESPLAEQVLWWPLFRSLVSLENLGGSMQTLYWNNRHRPDGCFDNGFRRSWASTHTAREEFEQMIFRFTNAPDLYGNYQPGDHYPQRIQSLLTDMRRAGIDVRVFIPPLHAVMLDAMTAMGIAEEFVAWKTRMVEMVATVNTETPGIDPLQLWDFSGYNSITTEPVTVGDETMYGYRDPSHFRPLVGAMVLDRLFGSEPTGDTAPADFGTVLTPENLPAFLAEQATRRADHDFSEFFPDALN